ncbi:CAP domain-containing protein [Modestobacter roseus]|uniref:CAP domain-containing protein n=1 Tax=Modestobacter roseus TaxID=1181884 RepID=UPI0034E000C2
MPPSPPRPSTLRRLDATLTRPLRGGGRQFWAPLLLAAVLVLIGSGATVVHGVVRTQLAETAAEAPQPEAAATPAPDTAPDDAAADVPADVPAEAVAETAATDPPAAESAAETEPAVSSSAPAPAPAPTPAPVPAPAPAPAPAAPAAAGTEQRVLDLVNAERATAGCPAVIADPALAGVARAHSADMRDRDYFSHIDPDGQDPFARARAAGIQTARAENIAYGQPDAAAVMAAWMASPGHRANILNCELGTLGVGVAEGAGGPWWTQLFGS